MGVAPPPLVNVEQSTVRLDPRLSGRRQVPVPRFARGPRFDVDVDPNLIFADIFREAGGQRILILAGSIPRHIDLATGLEIRCGESGRALARSILNRDSIRGPHWLIVDAGSEVSSLELVIGEQRIVRPVQPNLSRLFSGRRTLLCVSRDEPVERIVDWAWWHADRHGFDAVLHYDNASRTVDPAEVTHALRGVPGIDVVVTVSWPHAYMPSVSERLWDRLEAWGQTGAIWHGAQRFLRESECFFHADVDELLVAFGTSSLQQLLDDGMDWNAFIFDGHNVSRTAPSEPGTRHRDLHHFTALPKPRPKWIGRGSRMTPAHRLSQHTPHCGSTTRIDPTLMRIAHCMPLTTGWGHRNPRQNPVPPDPDYAADSAEMRRQLAEVYDRWLWSPPPPPPVDPGDAARAAWEALDAGSPDALDLLDLALGLDPRQPALAAARLRLLGDLPLPGTPAP